MIEFLNSRGNGSTPKWPRGQINYDRDTRSRSDTAHPTQFTIQTVSQKKESLLPEEGTGKGCRSVHSVFWLVLEPAK